MLTIDQVRQFIAANTPSDSPAPDDSTLNRIESIATCLKNTSQSSETVNNLISFCLKEITQLNSGFEILCAYGVLFDLPPNETLKEKLDSFFIETKDGTLRLPNCFKEALGKDSEFFKSLFFSGMKESHSSIVFLPEVTLEELELIIDVLMEEELSQNEELIFKTLKTRMTLCYVPEKIELACIRMIQDWSFGSKDFSNAYNQATLLSAMPASMQQAFSQYFFQAYLKGVEETKCCEMITALGTTKLAFTSQGRPLSKFYQFAQAFPHLEWNIRICAIGNPKTFEWNIRDKDVEKILDSCPIIRSLDIFSPKITEETTRLCAKKETLFFLYLASRKNVLINLEIAKAIAQLPLLNSLDFFREEEMTDEIVLTLLKTPRLTSLSLGSLDVREMLVSLSIPINSLPNEEEIALTENRSIKYLDLSDNYNLSDLTAFELAKMPLIYLNLKNTSITDKGLEALMKSPTLQKLIIKNCRYITAEAIKKLSNHPTIKLF